MSSDQSQEKRRSPFFIFNIPFTFVGFDLNVDDHPDERRSPCTRRFCLVALNWVFIAFQLWQPSNGAIFFKIGATIKDISQVMIQIYVLRHMSEIRKFMTKNTHINTRSASLIKWFSIIWMTAYYTMAIFVLILSIQSNEIARSVRIPYNALIDIFITSVPLQCLSVLILYARGQSQLNMLYTSAAQGRQDQLFDQSEEMKNMFIEQEKLFSLLTPTWIIYNFILTTFSLMSFNQADAHAFLFVFYFHQILSTIPILLMVWVKEEMSKHESLIVFAYAMASETGDREMSPALSGALREALSFQFTVWALLPINRELVFSFIGTVLTFSVLAIQIMNDSFVPHGQYTCPNVTKTCPTV